MCQGVILTQFEWKVGRKTVRHIAAGIGSHSELTQKLERKLKRLGWTETAKGQRVVSIESDFSKGYGKFVMAGGEATQADIKRLQVEYDRVAGSATALMRHIKKCGVDNALVSLLTGKSRNTYEDGRAQLWKTYEDGCAQLLKTCQDGRAQLLKTYEDGRAQLWKTYQDGCAQLLKTYQDGCASLWIAQFHNPANRVEHLR